MIDAAQRRARECIGLPDDRVHVQKHTVADDKFAVVVRECVTCGCNNARPCGTKSWTCEYCGAAMKIEGAWVSDWRHHDNYQRGRA